MNRILLDHIKKFEGCKLEAYKCPAGIWTVGYGCTGDDIKERTKWTQEYANSELEHRANECLTQAFKLSPILRDESQSRQAAIASFIFNCGQRAYRDSTLKKEIDDGHWGAAVIQIKRWNKGGGKVLPGLVKRRDAEAKLLLEAV